jgi:hypothetical protein
MRREKEDKRQESEFRIQELQEFGGKGLLERNKSRS